MGLSGTRPTWADEGDQVAQVNNFDKFNKGGSLNLSKNSSNSLSSNIKQEIGVTGRNTICKYVNQDIKGKYKNNSDVNYKDKYDYRQKNANRLCYKDKLKCIYFNARSIVNKLDELE